MSTIRDLIIVPGHAAFKANVKADTLPADIAQDELWALQSFQKGEPRFYIEHMHTGVELLQSQPQSLLVPSGGRTRLEAGEWSEAATNVAVARHYGWWSKSKNGDRLGDRTVLDEFARDSLENLANGVLRFRQVVGRDPELITVVGWKFKQQRFDLHRQALGIDFDQFIYIGCNDPVNVRQAMIGETQTLAQFQADPYAERSPLSDKRKARNPFHQVMPTIG